MNKSTMSILLAAMMAASGFAAAQPSPAPALPQGGSTTVAPAVDAGTDPKTRAEVKSEINTRSGAKVGAPAQGGGTPSGAMAKPAAGGSGSATTRADVKGQISNDSKVGALPQGSGTVSGAPEPKAGAMSSTSAERKAARAERKAMRKSERDRRASAKSSTSTGKGMDSGPGSPARTAPQ